MKKYDILLQEVKELQACLDLRTSIENEAIQLISECRFKEAQILLALEKAPIPPIRLLRFCFLVC
ncbi:hypothetical protein PM001_01735 [[Clostridium] symbiosum]|nr:hypothetical protein [[Clostridium] symbiosum]MDB2034823.1 hypothetical protein [[Clostridium] symbiosum]